MTTPATSPQDQRTRSERLGVRRYASQTTSPTDADTASEMSRLPNSIQGWNPHSGTMRSAEHWGQSSHPRPELVSRTADPVKMMPANNTAATQTTFT